MAVMLEGGCRVTTIREGEPVVAGTVRIWRQVGRDIGARAISLRTLEFGRGHSPMLANGDCDEVIYVLEGTGSIVIDDQVYEIEPEMGLYLRPGQTISVRNPGPVPIVLISSQCPEPDTKSHAPGDQSGPLGENRLEPLTPGPGREGSGTTNQVQPPVRPATAAATSCAPLVRLADRKALPTADRWYRVLVDDELGCTQVTQFIGSIPPGRAPDHFHLYEEVLFILRGEGRMWAGKTSTPIAAGSCIYLPKGQSHCVENTGKGELRLLGIFYPAGSPAVRYDTD